MVDEAPTEPALYAAVVETKGYVVGAENAASGLHRRGAGAEWTHLGWANVRNFGVAVVPGHPDTLFIAAGNGVLRTTDGGASWRVMTGWRVTEVLDVVVSPHAPEHVYAASAYGVWRSRDLGETWEQANAGIPTPQATYTPAIAADRQQEGHLIAGSEAGLFRSTDAGARWAPIGPRSVPIRDVQQSAADPQLWLAGTQGHGALISRDGGQTWQPLKGDAPQGTVFAVAADPLKARRIAVAGYDAGVYVSDDAGASWHRVEGLGDHHVHALAFEPSSGGRLWAGTLGAGVFYAEDLEGKAGSSWTQDGLSGAVVWDMDFAGVRTFAEDDHSSH